jgi:hypothetical protein
MKIQHYLCLNPSLCFYTNWQADPKKHLKIQGAQASQSNLEYEEKLEDWRVLVLQPTTKLQ